MIMQEVENDRVTWESTRESTRKCITEAELLLQLSQKLLSVHGVASFASSSFAVRLNETSLSGADQCDIVYNKG